MLGLGLARWGRCPGDLANTLDSAFRVLANERREFPFFPFYLCFSAVRSRLFCTS
jgi:hypothetical protein